MVNHSETKQEAVSEKGGKRPRRFMIVGLPRSGSTYLMTLLNSHPQVLCAGEQFNPYMIFHERGEDDDWGQVEERDRAPRFFSQKFYEAHDHKGYDAVGYKFMIGHNIRILSGLPDWDDIAVIYVWRKNKLAQISSLIKANETQRWAQEHKDRHINKKITAGPRKISQFWHEYETFDFLFSHWFKTLTQPKISLEYREMFRPGFEKRICTFLGVEPDAGMESSLVKQGSNNILDRFEYPEAIRKYFTKLGYQDWLGPEV